MRVLMPLPIPYDGTEPRYLARDGARLCGYLRSRGIEAVKLLVDDGTGHPRPCSPLLAAAPWRDWCSVEFWRRQSPSFVLLYGGVNPRLEPVAAALRSAGVPTALKMDSAHGIVAFPEDLTRLMRFHYYRARQRRGPLIAALAACAVQAVRATGVRHRAVVRLLSQFDWITVENPLSCANTQHWLSRIGRSDIAKRVVLLHHPVPSTFTVDPMQTKQAQVLALALDWANPCKRGKLLGEALSHALPQAEDYSAMIVGEHSEDVRAAALRCDPSLATRVQAHPRCAPEHTLELYQRARILAIPSGSEGAPNVVTEAACCGCSIVAAPELKQLSMFEDARCGTMARRYGAEGLAIAILGEFQAWARGDRDPVALSSLWGSQMHVQAVTQRLFDLFNVDAPG